MVVGAGVTTGRREAVDEMDEKREPMGRTVPSRTVLGSSPPRARAKVAAAAVVVAAAGVVAAAVARP